MGLGVLAAGVKPGTPDVGGIQTTASHNPIQWNGLKFLNRRGVAPPAGAGGADVHAVEILPGGHLALLELGQLG